MFDFLKSGDVADEREDPAVATGGNPGLKDKVVEMLKQVYDPEIPVNIYDLGLIYGLDVQADGQVHIRMTLTAPGCPVAQTFPGTVENAVKSVHGVTEATVELVWEPRWTKDRMSEEALLQLGML